MIKTEKSYANATISHDPSLLQEIHLPTKNIAIYQRDIELLQSEITPLVTQAIECRASGTIPDVVGKLTTYAEQHFPQAKALREDIIASLNLFQQITKAATYRLYLASVSSNMCRRFHTDINHLRMLCTYAGPATLWLPDEAADQNASRNGRGNQEIVIDEDQIQQARTGDIVILKGALYPDGNPILHRSPGIEKNGDKRLLLRIDANDARDIWS